MVDDEQAGHAVVVGSSIRQMRENPDGTFDLDGPDGLAEAFRDPADPHEPITGLVAIENTHAHSMGQPLALDFTREVARIAHAHGVPLHVDGARFFNASVALGLSPAELARPADSVAFCLSKGLACPIGSMVVGPRDFIHRAWRGRKLVGGGMRQVGVLAAAGLVALSDGTDARSNVWPRTTRTPVASPRGWPRWTASNLRAAWPSPLPARWTHGVPLPTS